VIYHITYFFISYFAFAFCRSSFLSTHKTYNTGNHCHLCALCSCKCCEW